MKKYLNIMLLALLTISLTSCFGKTTTQDDINDVKNDLLNSGSSNSTDNQVASGTTNIPKYEDTGMTDTGNITNTTSNSTQNNAQNNTSSEKYSVRYFGDSNFIEIDNLSKEDFANLKVKITGKTLVNVDKILVSFSNSTSSFSDSKQYQLNKFKAGDSTFLYNAFKNYESLDYGTNEYLIEAYSGDKIAKVEVVINIPKKGETTTQSVKTTLNNAPSNVNSSDIAGLTITQLEPDLSVTTSDELNTFLIDDAGIKTWFYWNSLRPIKNNIGVSFYSIILNGDNYTYSKHYYLPDGTYGVLVLEAGIGIDKENISEKNVEFKDKNASFDTTAADEYFKSLLNS